MAVSAASPFLRRALIADGAISGATGLLMLLGAGLLEGVLGVPATLMRYAGITLTPFAAFLIHLSRRDSLSRASVWSVIAVNAVWVVGSVMLLVSSRIEPNALGYAFIIGQAIAVAAFAEMQYVGLRMRAS